MLAGALLAGEFSVLGGGQRGSARELEGRGSHGVVGGRRAGGRGERGGVFVSGVPGGRRGGDRAADDDVRTRVLFSVRRAARADDEGPGDAGEVPDVFRGDSTGGFAVGVAAVDRAAEGGEDAKVCVDGAETGFKRTRATHGEGDAAAGVGGVAESATGLWMRRVREVHAHERGSRHRDARVGIPRIVRRRVDGAKRNRRGERVAVRAGVDRCPNAKARSMGGAAMRERGRGGAQAAGAARGRRRADAGAGAEKYATRGGVPIVTTAGEEYGVFERFKGARGICVHG